MSGESGKKLYEALEVLLNFVEESMAEPALDEVLNALIDQGRIARSYDGTGRAHDLLIAAQSFQKKYRKSDAAEVGFRGPAYDEPI